MTFDAENAEKVDVQFYDRHLYHRDLYEKNLHVGQFFSVKRHIESKSTTALFHETQYLLYFKTENYLPFQYVTFLITSCSQ